MELTTMTLNRFASLGGREDPMAGGSAAETLAEREKVEWGREKAIGVWRKTGPLRESGEGVNNNIKGWLQPYYSTTLRSQADRRKQRARSTPA